MHNGSESIKNRSQQSNATKQTVVHIRMSLLSEDTSNGNHVVCARHNNKSKPTILIMIILGLLNGSAENAIYSSMINK